AFLLYTSGIYFLLLLIITKEEKVSKVNLISFSLAILGVAIIMEFWNGEYITHGVFVGIFSGLVLAFLVFCKKKIYNIRIQNQDKFNSKGNFDSFLSWWSTIFLIVMFLPLGGIELLSLSFIDIIFSLILGFFPTALAFTLYNIGIKNDKGGNIVILSYFEPVMATINAAIFLRNLSIYTIIGGILILIANILALRYSK
ncbi:MAG: EamA family transporter, partial [Promethearchaeota archaeon]